MDTLNDIAITLRAARALLGIRQDQLADRAGVTHHTIARIEKARKGIPFETIEKVQNALEKDGVDFFPSTATHGRAVALRKKRQKSSS